MQKFKLSNGGKDLVAFLRTDGGLRPWPCVWYACMEDCLETGALCAEHELRYIAHAGKRSPVVITPADWHIALTNRGEWLHGLDDRIDAEPFNAQNQTG